ELHNQLSQYIDFEPSEIRLPITEEDVQEFRKIIADQEKMTDIVMDEYRFLLRYGHNSKGGEFIHIGWFLACTVADAGKVLINPSKYLSEKVLAHIEKKIQRSPTSASTHMVDI
ncbi:18751_t:CDS:1, partial [Gigaspora rosea]